MTNIPTPIFGPAVAQKSAEQPAECCQLVHVAHHAQRPEKSPRVSRHVGVQGQRPWDRYHRGNGIYLRSVLSCAQVLPVYNVQVRSFTQTWKPLRLSGSGNTFNTSIILSPSAARGYRQPQAENHCNSSTSRSWLNNCNSLNTPAA